MTRILRRIGAITLSITITAAAFAAVVVGGIFASGQTPTARPLTPLAPLTRPSTPSNTGKIVVAVVLGSSGSDAADVLAPFEVLASSPAFSVYTIADSTKPASLDGGISVQPDYAFSDVADGKAPQPDLVVVPAVNLPAGPEEQGARDFIAGAYSAGSHILGVCAGSRLLAASGILDGLNATSHWSRISALEESNPEVNWVRGQRYVQDGRVTTTGGVTSSIWGALRVMADMAGDSEAMRVGTQIAYPGWSLDAPTAMPVNRFGLADAAVLINTAFPWARPTIDVELADGVGEIDAAALFEVYTYSQAAQTRAVSEAGVVRTRHGLTLLTEIGGGAHVLKAGRLPGRAGYGGFDAAFEQLARTVSPGTVMSVSKMLEYPLDRVARDVTPDVQQWRSPALLALAIAISATLGAIPLIVRRLRRRA
ncbi:MAG: DJ-1/PfpI family protein [Pseudolysinimonas sp.]